MPDDHIPTVEFVMPFWGDPGQFREAVESIRAQDDADWRLTVIDDAYPDPEPGHWVRGLGDDRVRYRRNVENLGINRNFQAALDTAEADWVIIAGCDDRLHPAYLARVRDLAARHPGAALIHPGVQVIDDDGAPTRPLVDRAKALYRGRMTGETLLAGEDLATSITRGNWMYFPAIAWRREVAAGIGFRPGLDVAQDLGLALDVAVAGGELVYDPRVAFDYRRHAASVSSARAVDGRRFAEEQRFFREWAAAFRGLGWRRAARAADIHLSSRINAATRVPAALRAREWRGLALIGRHLLGLSITS